MSVTTKPDYGVVLKQMNGAIRRLEMYPPGHPASMQAMEKPFGALQEVFRGEEHFIISRVEDQIVVNGKHIEGADLLKRFLEEFENQDVNSITIAKTLTKEELNVFLSFFVKPLGKTEQTTSLLEFIKQNQIRSITVDQLRYELVTEDEVVVKSDAMEGADLKAHISKLLKDNPDLLRDVLLKKSGNGAGNGGGLEEASGQVSGGEGSGDGAGTGSGTGFDGKACSPELRQGIEEHVQDLSDDELLSLLVSSLELSVGKRQADGKQTTSELDQVVELVDRLLQDRERDKLLPRIKNILSEKGILDTEHLDYLFDERWLKTQEVLDELTKMIETLESKEVDPERFMFLWQRVISSDDSEIKSYAVDKLLFKLDSENAEARRLSLSALEKSLDHFVQNKMEFEFTFLKERLYQRIKDQLMPAGTFKDCSRLLVVIFGELIQRHKFREAHQILTEYGARLSPEAALPEDVRETAEDFIRQVSDNSTLGVLTSEMREGVPFQELKVVEETLEALDGERVARRLLDVFTSNDRAARMSALRVLSRLGQSSVSAFSDLLSDADGFERERQHGLLANSHWFRVRNVIYVLGNIPTAESLYLLEKLSRDPDVRVRLEVVKALEKAATSQSREVLVNLLGDSEDEVRNHAIASLTSLGDGACLEPLKEHFRRKPEDGVVTVAAIGKIGEEESWDFLLDVLWEKESAMSRLTQRAKDEIRVAALNALGKIGSPRLTGEIETFVKHKRRGLKSLLVKDKVTEAANRALKIIENKNRSSSHPNGVKEKAKAHNNVLT